MSLTKKHCVTVFIAATAGLLLAAWPVQAQTADPGTLKLQNALNQQQNAVQTALQQTTALVQLGRQAGPPPYSIYFQKQQYALQIALQQTIALKQASQGRSPSLHQLSVQQQFALQNALQQATIVQNSLSVQRTRLTPLQQQTLLQEQNNLMGLVSGSPPLSIRKTPR